jgi:all-trans-retinol 13,14-reductase
MLFLLNSIVYLVLDFPLNTVATNTLVIIGVLFSAVYPLKAPARQVYRDFAKYDWRVEVEPGKPRGEGEYDVVIVGAGIGGLTCGAILSKHGYRVLILEQHFQVGGFPRGNYL